jgi:menaquinone-9 beta-reductase
MVKHETDVLIVGGGPAGLATAIAARQQGLKVLVVDAARPPIDKACGEGLMPDSLQALAALGVTLEGVETGTFHGIRFLDDASSVEARFPNGVGRGIRRTLLHDLLIGRAQDAGAELAWETAVETRSGRVRLRSIGDIREPRTRRASVLGEIKYRWLVGADGHDSRVRRLAKLDRGSAHDRRIGLRRHFQVKPWTDLVEIYWGESFQAYVTPIAEDQVCVAVIARERISFEDAVEQLPILKAQLKGCPVYTSVKGALTVSRRLRSVTNGRVALVGEASGSADAITGEGLAMCFRQALVLGRALASGDLSVYEREHRRIMSLPQMMGWAMLLMDKSSWARTRTLRALETRPQIFNRMLSVHVGAIPVTDFGLNTALGFGWGILSA